MNTPMYILQPINGHPQQPMIVYNPGSPPMQIVYTQDQPPPAMYQFVYTQDPTMLPPVSLPPGTIVYAQPQTQPMPPMAYTHEPPTEPVPKDSPKAQPPDPVAIVQEESPKAEPADPVAIVPKADADDPLAAPSPVMPALQLPPPIAWEQIKKRNSFIQRYRYTCAGKKKHPGRPSGRCSIRVRLQGADPAGCFCWYHRDDYDLVSEEQRDDIRARLAMAINNHSKTMVDLALEQLAEYVN